jgi:hypothetical protein
MNILNLMADYQYLVLIATIKLPGSKFSLGEFVCLSYFSPFRSSKLYVVTGYSRWWSDYIKASPDKRYAYEVVMPELPCHLYVDLEVNTQVSIVVDNCWLSLTIFLGGI